MKRILEFLSPDRATRIAFLSFLVASPAYFICRSNHFCMAGHLQHSDDYTPLAYLTDGFWVIGFVCSIILAFRSDVTFRYVFMFALGVAFLCFADPRGIGGLLQIPVHVALGLFAIACLLGWIP
jgi:hypothetical protein